MRCYRNVFLQPVFSLIALWIGSFVLILCYELFLLMSPIYLFILVKTDFHELRDMTKKNMKNKKFYFLTLPLAAIPILLVIICLLYIPRGFIIHNHTDEKIYGYWAYINPGSLYWKSQGPYEIESNSEKQMYPFPILRSLPLIGRRYYFYTETEIEKYAIQNNANNIEEGSFYIKNFKNIKDKDTEIVDYVIKHHITKSNNDDWIIDKIDCVKMNNYSCTKIEISPHFFIELINSFVESIIKPRDNFIRLKDVDNNSVRLVKFNKININRKYHLDIPYYCKINITSLKNYEYNYDCKFYAGKYTDRFSDLLHRFLPGW